MVIPSLTGIFMEIPVWYDDPGPKYDPKYLLDWVNLNHSTEYPPVRPTENLLQSWAKHSHFSAGYKEN